MKRTMIFVAASVSMLLTAGNANAQDTQPCTTSLQGHIGSHKDRHEAIGKEAIIVRIINHPVLRKLPFLLETPNELDGYTEEIKILRKWYKED